MLKSLGAKSLAGLRANLDLLFKIFFLFFKPKQIQNRNKSKNNLGLDEPAVEAEADSDCEHRQPDVQWHQLLCHLMMIMIMMALMMMMMSMLMATVLAMAMAMAMMATCIFLRSVIAQTQRTRSPVARNWSPIPPCDGHVYDDDDDNAFVFFHE